MPASRMFFSHGDGTGGREGEGGGRGWEEIGVVDG